ncbi:MAG: hypothetical protein WDN47_00620 [Candidatus Doudnabacteria bacterium]
MRQQNDQKALVKKAVVASHLEFFSLSDSPSAPLTQDAVNLHFETCSNCFAQFQHLEALGFSPQTRYERRIMARVSILEHRPNVGLHELLEST